MNTTISSSTHLHHELHTAITARFDLGVAGNKSTSRAARHARRKRYRARLAAAGVLATILKPPLAVHTFTPGFAALYPLRATTHRQVMHMMEGELEENEGSPGMAWHLCVSALQRLGRRLADEHDPDVSEMNAVLAVLFVSGFMLRGDAQRAWRRLHDELQPLFSAASYLELQVAALGAFCQEPGMYMDLWDDEARWRRELVDMLLFVREDMAPELPGLYRRMHRGAWPTPKQCLLMSHPSCHVARLIKYARTCLRSPLHCYNEGLLTMVLQLARHAGKFAVKLAHTRARRVSVEDEMLKLGRVLHMERTRTLDVIESMPRGDRRDRLHALWRELVVE